jgi:predicted Zn-dependent protease
MKPLILSILILFSSVFSLSLKANPETLTLNASLAEQPKETKSLDIAKEQIRIQNMFNAFLTSIGKSPKDYKIEVIESKDINAFATLGRRIVINSELIKFIDSEAGLALVLAHELGHLERKHLVKSLLSQNTTALIRHYVFRDNKVASALSYVGEMHYSRETEKDADMFGIDLVNKLYCNVPGKLEFFEKMSEKESSGKLQEYFSTHPLSSTRLDYLREIIKTRGCVV